MTSIWISGFSLFHVATSSRNKVPVGSSVKYGENKRKVTGFAAITVVLSNMIIMQTKAVFFKVLSSSKLLTSLLGLLVS